MNDDTWERPKADFLVIDCILGSPSEYHGGRPRWVVCEELFDTRDESKLSTKEVARLQSVLQAEATWRIDRIGELKTIHSTKCLQFVPTSNERHATVCDPCWELRKNESFRKAVSRKYAEGDKVKHIRDTLMQSSSFNPQMQKYRELRDLNLSLETLSNSGDPRFWSTLGTHGSAGLFKNMDVFEGLVKAVASRATREKDGKSLRGLRVQQPWDDFTMTLWAISPAAGRFVQANLHSRDARSLRETRRLSGMQLANGLDLSNFERISEQIKKMGYHGPLALGSDQTVCVKTICVYNGCIVGAQGGDVEFTGSKDLQAKVKSILESDLLCTKVCTICVSCVVCICSRV